MKKCYVAGALNSSDCIGYLQNVSRMMETAESIRQLGVAPFIPGIDLLMGIKFGYYEYDDFFDCSQMWLDSSDFVYLTPQWEDSKGTRREIERAGKNGIPVFMEYDEVKEFLKPVIICIVGESGSGKTLMAEWFEKLFNYNLIQSYTTRPKRTRDENGHTFINDEQFDKFNFDNEEMIAFTKFGEYRYCCLKKDVKFYNTYVIDEVGLEMLKEKYSNEFHIYSIRVHASLKDRLSKTDDKDRVMRDEGRFLMKDNEFDFVYHNSYDLGKMINFVQITQNSVFSDFVSKCYNV
jgi:guanylate kinase